jgi:hypothetical protein
MDRAMIMESGVSDIIKNCTDFIMNQTSLKWLNSKTKMAWTPLYD